VLAADAAVLWDLYRAGWEVAALVELLREQFGLASADAQVHIDALCQQWRDNGLLTVDGKSGGYFASAEPLPGIPEPDEIPVSPDAWRLMVADRLIALRVEHLGHRAQLEPLLAPCRLSTLALDETASPTAPTAAPIAAPIAAIDRVALEGDLDAWSLTANGKKLHTGGGVDAALVLTLNTLIELGCRTRERLFAAHAAGLQASDGRGLLLVARGGSGKTTLATALNATGFSLLSDDVVPVTLEGDLLGLGLPLTLKSGAWPVLDRYRSDLAVAPIRQRLGRQVRFLPVQGCPAQGPVLSSLCLFPRYAPDQPISQTRLSPEQVLQGLIEADIGFRGIDQGWVDGLAQWIERLPAYQITYPDLETALAQVHTLLQAHAEEGGS